MVKDDILLSAQNIRKSFTLGKVRQHVLRGVNLKLRRGEFTAVMGASGSGKSTLLHILGLLDRPDEGNVFLDGEDIFRLSAGKQDRIRSRDIGFVFQFYHLLPELNVIENVMLPLMVACPMLKWPIRRRAAQKQAQQVLQSLKLDNIARQSPLTLSGGERQRVALARALVIKPRLLLADEPTGNLDSATGQTILQLLVDLNRQGQTILMVTHDPAIAEKAHRKLVLRDGKIG